MSDGGPADEEDGDAVDSARAPHAHLLKKPIRSRAAN